MNGFINNIFSEEKKNSTYVMLANIINKIIVMCTSMIVTRVLTKDDYGIWSYALNIYSYLTLVSGAGLATGALQFGTENYNNKKSYMFFSYCFKTGLLINLVLVFVSELISLFFPFPLSGAKTFIMLIIPVLLLDYINELGYSVLRSQNKIRHYTMSLNFSSVIVAIGTCVGSLFGVTGLVVGRYFSSLCCVLFIAILVLNDRNFFNVRNKLSIEDKKNLWSYSIYVGISAAMNCIVYYLDITFIASMIRDTIDVSVYRVGTQIPVALQFIPNSIVIAVFPIIIYNKDNIKWIKSFLKKLYVEVFVLNIIICSIVIITAPVLITILAGKQYLSSAIILQILTIGYFFSGTFRTISVNVLAAFRRVKYGLFISIISCALDVLFNYCLIIKYKMIGAAYSTVLVNIITAFISFIYVIYLIRKGIINETV